LSLIGWIKEIFKTKDNTPIGLNKLKKAEDIVSKPKKDTEETKKKKNLKNSDLMKGEIY